MAVQYYLTYVPCVPTFVHDRPGMLSASAARIAFTKDRGTRGHPAAKGTAAAVCHRDVQRYHLSHGVHSAYIVGQVPYLLTDHVFGVVRGRTPADLQ